MDDKQRDLFMWRLTETITWCEAQASFNGPGDCLRTPVLQPQPDDSYRYGLLSQGTEVVQKLSEKRADLLHSQGNYPHQLRHGLEGERLLIYQPDDSFAA